MLGSLHNEAFHAWFDQCFEERSLAGAWLWGIIDRQSQFGRKKREKAEEAMSEMIDQAIATLEEGETIPTYDDVMEMEATSHWRQAIKPGLMEEREKFARDSGAELDMTEELY